MGELKIGLTGSVHYENAVVIKNIMFKLRENIGTQNYMLVSCGNSHGADKIIKKIALEFGFEYGEFTDYYKQHNLFTIENGSLYNKIYQKNLYQMRNTNMANYITNLVYFGEPRKDDDNWLIDLINKTKKLDKNILKIN